MCVLSLVGVSNAYNYMVKRLDEKISKLEEQTKQEEQKKLLKDAEQLSEEFDLASPSIFTLKNVAIPEKYDRLTGRELTQADWFRGREYLIPLYDDTSQNIVLVKGRQVEMSTYIVNQLLYHALKYPGFYIYTSSDQEKAKYFSKERLLRTIMKSPKLKPLLGRDSNVHNIKLGDSTIHIYSAYGNLDAIRGYSANALVLDEFQDINADALGAAREVLSHSSLHRLWILGTPKLSKTRYEEYWNLSDKKEWRNGKWVPTNDIQDPVFSGYHLSQYLGLGVWLTERDFEEKRKTMSKQQWLNEVMGEFYEGVGNPITISGLWSLFDPMLPRNAFETGDILIAGIDWGSGKKSTTTWVLIRPRPTLEGDWAFDVLNCERISVPDVTEHYKRILQLIETTPVTTVIADEGEGFYLNADLYKRIGSKLSTIRLGSFRTPIKTEPTAQGLLIYADKTWIIDQTFDMLSKNKVRFYNEPNEEIRTSIIRDFMSVYPEQNETTGKKLWKKDTGMTDDTLMSLSFALTGWELVRFDISNDISQYIAFTNYE